MSILINQPILLENVSGFPRKPMCIFAKNWIMLPQNCAISITSVHSHNRTLFKNKPVKA